MVHMILFTLYDLGKPRKGQEETGNWECHFEGLSRKVWIPSKEFVEPQAN